MARIDLNCDMGESFGAWTMGHDAEVMSSITSANVACGFHAGDPEVMRRTVRLAKQHGVAVGVHPGLPDLVGFGRREMKVSPGELEDMMLYQIGALAAIADAEGVSLQHVKPHGALYNMTSRHPELAAAIARAVASFDRELILLGLPGSPLIRAGQQEGLRG
jgi:5-oxoprolinase (ATP-hydrolysing) subunit A